MPRIRVEFFAVAQERVWRSRERRRWSWRASQQAEKEQRYKARVTDKLLAAAEESVDTKTQEKDRRSRKLNASVIRG
jgi:hypothetical protein